MKMKMRFRGWERKMKRLINSMMIHLGQVQLVSDIKYFCLPLVLFLPHLENLVFSKPCLFQLYDLSF